MKSATKAKVKRAPRIDKTKYDQFVSYEPISFSESDKKRFTRCIFMKEDEFNNLSPRLICEQIIGWTKYPPGKESQSTPIKVEIYITDGITTVDNNKKINVAYSYYVRYGNRTYKPWFLDQCFQIVNAIRLEGIDETYKAIARDKKAGNVIGLKII